VLLRLTAEDFCTAEAFCGDGDNKQTVRNNSDNKQTVRTWSLHRTWM
jgi:hypothetical protein